MALPELLLPSSTPPFLAVEHVHSPISLYSEITWATGHSTKRRLYTTAPRIVSVALDMDQDSMTDFHYWFEGPARGGSEYFSCQLANFGPGLLWFKTRFLRPYVATPDHTGMRWEVKFQLYVVGTGSLTAPVSTSAGSTRTLPLAEESVVLTVTQSAGSTRMLVLDAVLSDAGSTRILALESTNSAPALIQETGGFYITQEDGSLIEL